MKKTSLKPVIFDNVLEYARAINMETVVLHKKCDQLQANIHRNMILGIIFGAIVQWRLSEQEQRIEELSKRVRELREEREE